MGSHNNYFYLLCFYLLVWFLHLFALFCCFCFCALFLFRVVYSNNFLVSLLLWNNFSTWRLISNILCFVIGDLGHLRRSRSHSSYAWATVTGNLYLTIKLNNSIYSDIDIDILFLCYYIYYSHSIYTVSFLSK